MVTTRAVPPPARIVGIEGVAMSGRDVIVDSFNSSTEEWSTAGRYDSRKRRDKAGVGTLSSAAAAINTGTARIFGIAVTGPGGTVAGNVGDGGWHSGNSGIQPGSVSDDFNMAITDVKAPFTSGAIPRSAPKVDYIFAADPVTRSNDFYLNRDVRINSSMVVSGGKVRVYVTGTFSLNGSGEILIEPGATLELYLGGKADFTGGTIVNGSAVANNFCIFGLPTCTEIKMGGQTEVVARLYAPQAHVELGGNYDYSGSMVGRTLKFHGTGDVHYDEALDSYEPAFRIVSWEEL